MFVFERGGGPNPEPAERLLLAVLAKGDHRPISCSDHLPPHRQGGGDLRAPVLPVCGRGGGLAGPSGYCMTNWSK